MKICWKLGALASVVVVLVFGGCEDNQYSQGQVDIVMADEEDETRTEASPDQTPAVIREPNAGNDKPPSSEEPPSIDTPPEPVDCSPQEAYEDPDVDCDGCTTCADRKPWIWDGEQCSYMPICCECAGEDCDALFSTYEACRSARETCGPEATSEYPNAKLTWHQAAGFAGSGPLIRLDGNGLFQLWFETTDPRTETEPDQALNIGPVWTSAVFRELAAAELEGLPRLNEGPFEECSISLRFQFEACPNSACVFSLNYETPRQIRPEFNRVYAQIQNVLCDLEEVFPNNFCIF